MGFAGCTGGAAGCPVVERHLIAVVPLGSGRIVHRVASTKYAEAGEEGGLSTAAAFHLSRVSAGLRLEELEN